MRVALDATPLTLSSGGLRRYVSELSRALTEGFPEDDFLLTSDQPFAGNGPEPRNALERRWWSWGLPRALMREHVEVFHGTNFEVPYLPLRPSVLTFHDLSPWLDPAWHTGADRVRSRTPRLVGLGIATMVIAPSEAVRREAIERFRIPHQRIVTVPEAASPCLHPAEPRPEGAVYFLFVGTLEPRKNLTVILEAWREVRNRFDVELVLAGRRRDDFPELPAEPGLRVLGEVADSELSPLYSNALAFLYPSLYEGFGLPVVEAMQCGAAVFASRTPAICEVSAGAAVELDPRDVRAWKEALTAACERPDWIAELRARSLERAEAFSWAATARRTREVYAEAVRRFA